MHNKLLPNEQSEAIDLIESRVYELLEQENWLKAGMLAKFLIEPALKRTDIERKYALLNVAQCLKWTGENAKCRQLLAGQDWTAVGTTIKLAVLVLQDKFVEAEALMGRLGKEDLELQVGFASWPIFKEFRKSQEFANGFKALYGKEFGAQSKVEVSKDDMDSQIGGFGPIVSLKSGPVAPHDQT
jgi:hypothetical protein